MLRFAKTEDTEALLDIYGQYMDTPITFEYELPSKEEFAGRIRDIGSYYPYLVWEENGKIAGYKCGKWHDVIWYEKAIREFEANPQPIRSMHEIPEQKLAAILKDVSAVIKS